MDHKIPIQTMEETITSLAATPQFYEDGSGNIHQQYSSVPILILDLWCESSLSLLVIKIQKLLNELRKYYKVIYLLVPFPKQILYQVTIENKLQIISENEYFTMPYPVPIFPTSTPFNATSLTNVNATINETTNSQDKIAKLVPRSSRRRRTLMINHFYNEEFLMPHFIRSHAHHFDKVIMIDYNSTDSSVEIIKVSLL